MSEDIVDELREAARVIHKEISGILGSIPGHTVETSVPWQGADAIESLRLSLKEAEASRAQIIEECAKVADAYAKEMWGHTEEEAAAEEIAKAIRALKGKPNG